MKKKSIAIIGEGETEWFYLDSLRVAQRYPFQMKPSFPQHSHWSYILKQAHQCQRDGYDIVICLIDMDVLHHKPSEMPLYRTAKSKAEKSGIQIIETNPCTEFWFLLHFLPHLSTKVYTTYEEVVSDLCKYLPKYEKSKKYFQRTPLYQYLTEHGDLSRATNHARQLLALAKQTPEDLHSYTHIHELLIYLDHLCQC